MPDFHEELDTEAMDVVTGSNEFARDPRYRSEMQPVLYSPLPAGESINYWNFRLEDAGDIGHIFKQSRLTYSMVLLPSGKVGVEYVKTHGHYHSAIPGVRAGYPEVYTHLYGTLYLFLQRRIDALSDQLDDCVLYSMIPGQSITIPPGYAHIVINPSNQPGLMAGLYSRDSIHDYKPVDDMAGAAYYVIEQNGQESIVANPRYKQAPPIRLMTDLGGTAFALQNQRSLSGNPLSVTQPGTLSYTIPRLARINLEPRI